MKNILKNRFNLLLALFLVALTLPCMAEPDKIDQQMVKQEEIKVDDIKLKLADKNSKIRIEAIDILSKRIDDQQAAKDIESLLKDTETSVRQKASEGLGKLKAVNSINLLSTLLDDKEVDVRKSAAWALGEMAVEPAVDKLIANLKEKEKPVRLQIIKSLGKLKYQKTAGCFYPILSEKDPDIIITTIDALADINEVMSVRWVANMVYSSDKNICLAGIRALGRMKGVNSDISPVKTMLEVSEDSEIILAIIKIIPNYQPDSLVFGRTLIKQLSNKDPQVQQASMNMLKELTAKSHALDRPIPLYLTGESQNT